MQPGPIPRRRTTSGGSGFAARERRLVNLDVHHWEASCLHQMIELARHRVVEAARWAKARKQIRERAERAGGSAARGRQIAVFHDEKPSGPENAAHLAEAGRRIDEVQQQEPAVDEVCGIARQTCRDRAGLDKGDVCQSAQWVRA